MSNTTHSTSNNDNDDDTGETFEVHVAIYDLSRGMARSLSGQFLGPQYAIDAIPHTGIVVYGLEYFFGAGIQCEEPQAFRQSTGMFPFQTISLGRTRKNRFQFEQWCVHMKDSGQYTHASYDFLLRNCNNFSHDAAIRGLGLARGVPDWVLDVPRRFLSSPMGQMVRPMLETMQLGNVAGADHIGQATTPISTTSPTTAAPLPRTTPTAATVVSTTGTTSEAYNPWLSIVPPPPPPLPSTAATAAPVEAPIPTTTPVLTSDNPWAAAVADPPPPPPPRPRSTPRSSASAPPPPPPTPKLKNTSTSAAATTILTSPPPPPPPPAPKSKNSTNSNAASVAPLSPSSSMEKANHTMTPLLDSFTKPLLSTETNTLPLCVKKITATIIPSDTSVGATLQQERERSALLQAQDVLSKHSTSLTTMNETLAETIGRILLKCLQRSSGCVGVGHEEEGDAKNTPDPENVAVLPFVLMMLRIVVLKMPSPKSNMNTESSSSLEACLQWVERNLLQKDDGVNLCPVARAMAWLTISNAYCGGSSSSSMNNVIGANATNTMARRDALVEAAMAEINPDFESRPEVRQAASAFLYNMALLLLSSSKESVPEDGDVLPDLHISILCATLENVASEVDATTRLRRLMAAGRILQPIVTHPIILPTNSSKSASSSSSSNGTSNGSGPPPIANGAARGRCDELPHTALTNAVAKQLALDLGFAENLQAIVNAAIQDSNNDPSNVNYHKLAAELLQVLNS